MKQEFANRISSGTHPDMVFKQILSEIHDHYKNGHIDNKDAHRAANEAFGRLLFSRKKRATRKQSWMGWGPKARKHKVAGWDWDDYQNGFISTAHRNFQCSCGEPIEVPSYHNCKCGKIWNSYPIMTGGGKKNATAEKWIAREIPVREDVIVAKKKKALDLQNPHYEDYDKWENDIEHQRAHEDSNPFPSKHNPVKTPKSKGVNNGKTPTDWHKRDHKSQQWR